jgi:peptidyl-prolyl cis-trans isomerase SurA
MRALYEDHLYETLLEDEIVQLTRRDSEFRFLLNEYYEGILLFNIMEDVVWSKAMADSTGMMRFFDRHRDRYRWEKRARTTIYSSGSGEVLDSIDRYYSAKDTIVLQTAYVLDEDDVSKMVKGVFLQVHEAGDLMYLIATGHDRTLYASLESHLVDMGVESDRIVQSDEMPARGIAEIRVVSTSKKTLEWIFNRESPLTLEVREGLYEKGDESLPDGMPWSLGSHRLFEPDLQHLVVVHEIMEPAHREFDGVKGRVVSAYQDHLEQGWLGDLREKYSVEIYNKVLQKLY